MTQSYEWNSARIDVVALTHILHTVAQDMRQRDDRVSDITLCRIPHLIKSLENLLDINVKAMRFSDYQNQSEILVASASVDFSLPCAMVQALMDRDRQAMADALAPVMGLWTFRTVGEAA